MDEGTPPTAAETADKAKKALAALGKGKALYTYAEKLLGELMGTLKVGEVITLDNGRRVTIVDEFADKHTAFKTVGVNRFRLGDAPAVKGEKPAQTKRKAKAKP